MKLVSSTSNVTGKKFTNHSERKNLVQKLSDESVPPTDILQISGHRNVQSVLNHSSIREKTTENILTSSQQ